MQRIGKVVQKGTDTFEWAIPHFSRLSKDEEVHFASPTFRSPCSKWCLIIYPYGRSEDEQMQLKLFSLDLTAQQIIHCTLGLQRTDGAGEEMTTLTGAFNDDDDFTGVIFYKFNKRAEECREGELLSSDTLTVIVHLRIQESEEIRPEALDTMTGEKMAGKLDPTSPESNEFVVEDIKDDPDFQTLKRDMRQMFCDQRFCDVVLLSSDNQRFPAHKVILEARSSAFSEMFQRDMAETRRNEILIEDIEGAVLKELLNYIYTASLDNISSCDLIGLFAAADKYGVGDLKKECARLLIGAMSTENVCDAIVLGHMFKIQELKDSATSFFSKEASEVMESTFWEKFVKEHSLLAVEILKSVILSQKV